MEILIAKSALMSALAGARAASPNEFICLLVGRNENGRAVIEDTMIPPGIAVSETMSSFSEWMLPVLENVVGTFHSHPEGNARPSPADLRLFSRKGGVNLIACAPFGIGNVAAYLGSGKREAFRVLE